MSNNLPRIVRRSAFLPGLFLLLSLPFGLPAQTGTQNVHQYDSVAAKLITTALGQNKAIEILSELCTKVGARLAGSPKAAQAVNWAQAKMTELGSQNVRLEPVTVPHWVRGKKEVGFYRIEKSRKRIPIHLTALGGSVGTLKKGMSADVIEVKSWEELETIGDRAKGKIVLFNRPMDRTLISTGVAYSRAVDQRVRGAIEAAKHGAVAALVRSMSTRYDDVPHTGMMDYVDSVARIPAAAISTNDANTLDNILSSGKKVRAFLKLSCDTLAPVASANVVGEIVGSEKPEEVVLVGGHLDSWDKGQGAHDDGAGCIHTLEALRLIKELGLKPKRTIRAVLFMNEEHGLNGGLAYAAKERPNEKLVAALESDAGGFSPRGFNVSDSIAWTKLSAYSALFRSISADRFQQSKNVGSDIGPLVKKGVVGIGLNVDNERYFDYHHSDSDTIDKVNERELALGAAAEAILIYVIAQEGM